MKILVCDETKQKIVDAKIRQIGLLSGISKAISFVFPVSFFVAAINVVMIFMGILDPYIAAVYAGICIAMGGLLKYMLRAFLINPLMPDLLSRMCEEMEFCGNEIIYSFRIRYRTTQDERTIIHIPVSLISKVDYEKETKKLILYGDFSSEYVVNYGKANCERLGHEMLNEFVIYDYFEPSVYNLLKKD